MAFDYSHLLQGNPRSLLDDPQPSSSIITGGCMPDFPYPSDPPKTKTNPTPMPNGTIWGQPRPPMAGDDIETLIRILTGGKVGLPQRPSPSFEPPADDEWDPHGGCFGTGGWRNGVPPSRF
jgi:hypothetical protein